MSRKKPYQPDAATALEDVLKYLSQEASEEEYDVWCGKGKDTVSSIMLETWQSALQEAPAFLRAKFRDDESDHSMPVEQRTSYCPHCGCTLFRVFTAEGEPISIHKIACASCGAEYRAPKVAFDGGNLGDLED